MRAGATGQRRARPATPEDGHANRTLAELERAHRGAYVLATLRAAFARTEGAAGLGLDHQLTEGGLQSDIQPDDLRRAQASARAAAAPWTACWPSAS